MQQLQHILDKIKVDSVNGRSVDEVNDLQIDSRKVTAGSCFIAINGSTSNGHDFIGTAITNGATVIICEHNPAEIIENVMYLNVSDTEAVAGIIAHNFYGKPSDKIKLIGVTGTNGKTTIATLLHKLFSSLGYKSGLISTVQNQVGDKILPSTHTTPDVISLNALLAKMVNESCTHAFMEVSSHALHQHRVAGLYFTGGIFSNITHDHLDYHKTFDEYINVKKSFFDKLPPSAFAITNADDKRGAVMLQNTRAKKYFYSLKTLADFKGKILENSLTGLLMIIDEVEVHFKLIGAFNAYNLLAVYGAAVCSGEDKHTVLQVLSNLSGAEGRFDYMISPKEKVIGIIDYAHTPDALLNVLATIKNLRQGNEQILTVVGCGGDRDKTKRPVMAEVACEHSNRIFFTSDNPRSEDPEQIIKEMESGVTVTCRKKYISIADRKEAIKTAVSFSNKEDIVLVAGKGHEKYQEIKGHKYPFDDKAVLMEMFELLGK
ncbi:MAG: UDP-N-acetylmuramoyl-L-alanyl-D-glutamate--2,6-diaminopimelate ligase [Chitinophagaceae bacterium]|nr:UDP-N-acetylmuramoyl-L-alanyl-D-glutamate--2,6-diaminopimelate ligase [Chitinophagaceae bacterium]